MAVQVSIQAESMVDTRGDFRRKPIALAPRLSNLNGKTVLLFDNTQLTTQRVRFGPIFQWLSGYLQSEHGAICSSRSQNLLKGSQAELVKLADEISHTGIDAVVIALCNAGITQPTSLFAAELELRGIPCVQICTDMGYALAGSRQIAVHGMIGPWPR